MLLGVIPMFCFETLRIFGEKSLKSKAGNLGYQAPTPQRREPTPWRRPTPRRGMPLHGEAKLPKWHPLGTPRCSSATQRRRPTPRRSYYSQRAKIFDVVPKF